MTTHLTMASFKLLGGRIDNNIRTEVPASAASAPELIPKFSFLNN
jgi:hypothetical protein